MEQTTGKSPRSNDAANIIAGFRYQILQSIAALIDLRDDEELLLEVSEDFSVVSDNVSTDVQVKNSQAVAGPRAFSLQSSEVRAAISRFWEASEVDVATERYLVFLARGGAAVEQQHSFPGGVSGLVYWKVAANGGDTTPIKSALQSLFRDQPISRWLASNPTDDELRNRLLRRVNWQLDQRPADALILQACEQVSEIYHSKRLPVSAAEQAVDSLIALVFEVASRRNSRERILKQIDLHRILDKAAGVALVAREMSGATPTEAPVAQEILVSEFSNVSPNLATRTAFVANLCEQVRGRPLVWLHGSHGIGKSTLARLLAQRLGGRWLVLDLRPVQNNSVASIATWRELVRVRLRRESYDGIIIDDFASKAAVSLRSRLSALVNTASIGGVRVILTSNRAPLPGHLIEFGADATCVVQAPYFQIDDIAELVQMSPAPSQELAQAWSTMILLTTGGGQPLLVAGKVASLRARGWPMAAMTEDVASTSQVVKLTRDEARRSLLDDLQELDEARSLDAGRLLRRIACTFDRVEDGLIYKLAHGSPALSSGSDALSILRGTWLEELHRGDLRISPLISDITSDMPPSEVKRWRRLAAEYWIEKRTLDERTLPLCFWNAFLGEHDGVLLKLCEVHITMAPEKLRAAAPILSPITAFATDKSMYGNHQLVAVYLRLLQFEIADAIEEGEVAARIAERLIVEINELDGIPGILLMTVAGPKVMMAGSALVLPSLRLKYAQHIRNAYRLAQEVLPGPFPDPQMLLPPQFQAKFDFADFLFVTVVQHVRGSGDILEAFQALDGLTVDVRNNFIDATSMIFSGPSVFVNSGWSQDQIAGRNMQPALDDYNAIVPILTGWQRPDLEAEVACARSVILDEGLNKGDEAIAVIDAAIAHLGLLPPLVRQKSKVFGHAGQHELAAELLLSIEDLIGTESPLERALALRDGGVSAAKANQLIDAIRLFDKAHNAISDSQDFAPFASTLLVEHAFVLWRAGEKSKALVIAANALDAVEAFPHTQSRQAERAHQFARAILGLFSSECRLGENNTVTLFTFGDASTLEDSSSKLLGVDLKPIADSWRLLAVVESELGIDIGIEERSMAKQSGKLLFNFETIIRQNRFATALLSTDIERILRAGIELVNAWRVSGDVETDSLGLKRIDASRLSVGDMKSILRDAAFADAIQSILLDVLLAQSVERRIDREFLIDFSRTASRVFGSVAAVESIMGVISGLRSLGPVPSRAEILASGIAIVELDVENNPSKRFVRDVMTVDHLAFSMARPKFAHRTASKLAEGWKFVIDQQRFLLRNPRDCVPSMKAAIARCEVGGIAALANLLIVAADAVTHGLPEGWLEMLRTLGKDTK